MSDAYVFGSILGMFVAGALPGILPLIVAIIKKRAMAGVILMILCGVVGFIQPILSLAWAVVSAIVLCFIPKKAK